MKITVVTCLFTKGYVNINSRHSRSKNNDAQDTK